MMKKGRFSEDASHSQNGLLSMAWENFVQKRGFYGVENWMKM
jgi:hypothetical protein